MSDIPRVYADGQEPALGNQTGGKPYPDGTERAYNGNADRAVAQASGKELTKLPHHYPGKDPDARFRRPHRHPVRPGPR
jgi:hypothetical protein